MIWSRRLLPLLLTQSLAAINDNMFKTALAVLVLFQAERTGPALVAASAGVFILPYVLFSAPAGEMADKWEKSRSIRVMKWAELALMAAAAASLLLGNVALMFAVLFGLGVQATFFSPLKYGILPSHLSAAELVGGNGWMEAGTFLGILIGTIAGGALAGMAHGPAIVGAGGLLLAAAGVLAARSIPPAPAQAPALQVGWNAWHGTRALFAAARADPAVWRCLLALSWFWALGATLLAELATLVRGTLHGPPAVFTLLLTVFSVGVGLGSVLCGRLMRGEVTARLVPYAAVGLTVFMADFALACWQAGPLPTPEAVVHSLAGWRILADLLALAACGGLYSVPLYAVAQDRAAAAARARVIAANNVLNAAAIVAAAVVTAALALRGASPVVILLLFAAANLAVAGWLRRRLLRAAPLWRRLPSWRGRS